MVFSVGDLLSSHRSNSELLCRRAASTIKLMSGIAFLGPAGKTVCGPKTTVIQYIPVQALYNRIHGRMVEQAQSRHTKGWILQDKLEQVTATKVWRFEKRTKDRWAIVLTQCTRPYHKPSSVLVLCNTSSHTHPNIQEMKYNSNQDLDIPKWGVAWSLRASWS